MLKKGVIKVTTFVEKECAVHLAVFGLEHEIDDSFFSRIIEEICICEHETECI